MSQITPTAASFDHGKFMKYNVGRLILRDLELIQRTDYTHTCIYIQINQTLLIFYKWFEKCNDIKRGQVHVRKKHLQL